MNTHSIALTALILITATACGDNNTAANMPGSGGDGDRTAIGDGGAGGSTDTNSDTSSSSYTIASSVGAGGDVNAASSSVSSSSSDASSSSSDAASSSSSGEPAECFTDCGGLPGWMKQGAYCGEIPKCDGSTLDCGGCASPMWCNTTDHLCKCLSDSDPSHTCPGTQKPSRCGGYDALKVPDDCGYGGDYWCCGPL